MGNEEVISAVRGTEEEGFPELENPGPEGRKLCLTSTKPAGQVLVLPGH